MLDTTLPPLRMPDELAARTDSLSVSSSTWDALKLVGVIVGGAAVGIAAYAVTSHDGLGFDMRALLEISGVEWMQFLALAAGGVFVVLCALAAHEAGHLVGGWMRGFRFQLFAVGPLMLTRSTDGGVQMQWHSHWALYGGIALALPSDHDPPDPSSEAWMVAGGPTMSLLLGCGALAGAWALGFADTLRLFTSGFLWYLGFCSFGIALVTLIPTTTSGFLTDGARLWRYWTNHPAAERDAAVFALTAASATKRPRNWDPALVAQAMAKEDGTVYDASAHLLAYQHYLDAGNLPAARAALQTAVDRYDRYPPSLQPALTAEAAFFEGAVRADAGAASRWLAVHDETPPLGASARHRAAAAVTVAAGNDATDAIDAATKALSNQPFSGLRAAERDWIAAIADHERHSASSST
jgi:hypothetical protein